MNIFKVFGKMNLQTEYKRLLDEINPHILNLNGRKDATLCLEWLSKLDNVKVEERAVRNELLRHLKECIMKKQLKHPFSESPPDKPLNQIIPLISLRSSTMIDNEGASDNCDPVCQYQQRSKKYKTAISKYQTILKDLLEMSVEDTDRARDERNAGCRCDDSSTDMIELDTNISQRVANIEKELAVIRTKSSLEKLSQGRKKHKGRGKRENVNNIKKLLKNSDWKMNQIQTELRNTTFKDISAEYSQLEKTIMDKCTELEKKYQLMLNDLAEVHRKEREADRQLIEKYQKMAVIQSAGRSVN